MRVTQLFQRNFTIMILGQIISLFGNAMLRFSLSLYVLDLTGSAAAFGTILAISMIPTILFSPFGGVLADRMPRQRIMVVLDFFTAGLIFLFAFLFVSSGYLVAITIFMILLSLIQAFYQPSVQASIPSLVSEDQLMAANGVALQVQALSSLLGPILGGFLYGYLGIFWILLVSGVCFFLSAVMELFLRIPFLAQQKMDAPLRQIKKDLADALHFLVREKSEVFWLLIVIAGINLFLTALFLIGLPFLVKVYLGLSSQLYGFVEGAMGMGSIVGGFLSGPISRHIGLKKTYRFLMATTLLLLPIVFVLALSLPSLVIYGVLMGAVFLGMSAATLFSIAAQTFMQKLTPEHLLGKISAFVSTVCTCAIPLGQAMYGGLFEGFQTIPWAVVLFGCVCSFPLVLAARWTLRRIQE